MPKFTCTTCGKDFNVPEAALEKYPNWIPRYCREHSPKRAAAETSKETTARRAKSRQAAELDLPVAKVLENFSGGPQSGIFTDGSARPNPGPGGWGLVKVQEGEIIRQLYGSEGHTTNNRMELTALIEAYKIIEPYEEIDVYSDSELCVNTITRWAHSWEKRGWKRKGGEIKNLELVKELYTLAQSRPKAKLKWIQAHNGWLWNEYADSLATAWAREEL